MSWRRRCGTSGLEFLPRLIRHRLVTSLPSSNTYASAPFPNLLPREPRWLKVCTMGLQTGSPVRPHDMTQTPMVLLKSQRVFASSGHSRFGPLRLLAATSLNMMRLPG